MKNHKTILILFLYLIYPTLLSAQSSNLMPWPSSVVWSEARFQLGTGFHVVLDDTSSSRAGKAVNRFLVRLDNRTTLLLPKTFYKKPLPGKGPYLVVKFKSHAAIGPEMDESYQLRVTGDQAELSANTDIGVVHGLETFLQLINSDDKGYFLKGVEIKDTPRFSWRGLLIDVGRHFSPVDVIKRNLDAMAMVKLNVLHLHISEDQGFRIESKKYPKLQNLGSNGQFYTQQEIKELIQYASDRGIRVVPEFDMPGHSTSWFVGYPELASAPGPYTIEKKFGVFGPSMDPTKKFTYKFLKNFLMEMCKLFPDPYFHIGGDENDGHQWDQNKKIIAFMKKKGFTTHIQLQNYFNTKVMAILKKNRKKTIGWDEILQPGLPSGAVIQSWRGSKGLKDAAEKGFQVILSNGYYIDLSQPAWQHYQNDPLPVSVDLTADQQKMVLGGEATMWAELVTPENIDSRIWPRTAAIAERLWSPREVKDVDDMYRRLGVISRQLEEVGIQNLRNRDVMLRRLAQSDNIAPLQILVDVVEPLKQYKRHSQGIPYSTDLPFTRLPDIAFPESETARRFSKLCEKLVMRKDTAGINEIREQLLIWKNNYLHYAAIAKNVPAINNWDTLSMHLSQVAMVGLESLDRIVDPQGISTAWVTASNTVLNAADAPSIECSLAIVAPVRMLFQYALPKE